MISFFKKYPWLVIIICVALFFYVFRVKQTFVMAGDTSRDLIDIMRIWQNKEITVIGEPVNTISNNPIQVFFSSLHLYLGLIGLLLFRFDPIGSIFVNIALATFSIPFFFILSKKFIKNESLSYLATLVYSLSPVIVSLTRSYWEPNTIIAISVFAWYLFLCQEKPTTYLLAGVVSGIIFDIHYMNAIVFIFYIFLLFFQKNKKFVLLSISGFILAISPLIIFELRNNLFLTKAFVGTFGGFSTFSQRTNNPFLSIDTLLYLFGLGPKQYFVPAIVNLPFDFRIMLNSVVGVLFLNFLLRKQKVFNSNLVKVILVSLLLGWFFEKDHLLALRYILSSYPLFVIVFVSFLSSVGLYILIIFLMPMLTLSTLVITHKLDPSSKDDYYSLAKIERIAQAIVADHPEGSYNITENILGDARSLVLRFYLLRDAQVKPQQVEVYDKIDTLYVLTPSLERTYQEDRWEFSASGPKRIVWQKDFDGLQLIKFMK